MLIKESIFFKYTMKFRFCILLEVNLQRVQQRSSRHWLSVMTRKTKVIHSLFLCGLDSSSKSLSHWSNKLKEFRKILLFFLILWFTERTRCLKKRISPFLTGQDLRTDFTFFFLRSQILVLRNRSLQAWFWQTVFVKFGISKIHIFEINY